MKTSKTPKLEPISPPFGSSLAIADYKGEAKGAPASWHFHPEMEIVFVNGGNGKRHIGNHISYYTNGDLIFIGPNLPHFGFTNRLTENKSEVVIHIKEDFLSPQFFEIPEMQHIQKLFERSKQGIIFTGNSKREIGGKIEALLAMPPFKRMLSFIEILQDMALSNDYQLLNVAGVALESKPQDTERLDAIYQLVSAEFQRAIALSEAAELVSMSDQAFSRYFKSKTGKTFTQFVNEYRLVHACKLLSEKHLSITSVCYECGFNNFSHFNKKFKDYTGKSPSQFRNEIKTMVQ